MENVLAGVQKLLELELVAENESVRRDILIATGALSAADEEGDPRILYDGLIALARAAVALVDAMIDQTIGCR